MGFLSGIMILLSVVALVVGIPVFLSWFLNRGRKPSRKWQETGSTSPAPNPTGRGREDRPEDAVIVDAPDERPTSRGMYSNHDDHPARPESRAYAHGGETEARPRPVGSARRDAPPDSSSPTTPETIDARPSHLDFETEVKALTRLCPEADGEFFRRFFDLFRKVLNQHGRTFSQARTPDELMAEAARRLPPLEARHATRLSEDWELVAFANMRPGRPFSEILDDARHVLHHLHKLENLS